MHHQPAGVLVEVDPQVIEPEVRQIAGHRVRRGETLRAIARRHGTSAETLARINGLGTVWLEVALPEANRAIAANPNLAPGYNLRGLINAALGKDDAAESDFRRALAINPRDADALQNYGWYLCQHSRHEEANAQFAQALALPQRRESARTWLAQGVCHARAGRLEDAEKALQRSYQMDAGNPSTSVNLAEVLLRRGEAERARFHIRRVNANVNYVSAQTLWLAVRIERRMGNSAGVQELGQQLLNRFPETREAVAFQRGQFDE